MVALVQRLVNFTIFSTTPQFFQIIQAETGDTKKQSVTHGFSYDIASTELPSSEDEKPGGYHSHKLVANNNADNQMVSQTDACDSKKMSLRAQNT